jgi:predicted transcriptional regulator
MFKTESVKDLNCKDVSYILKQISDDRALILFNQIAISNGEQNISLKEMNLTTKQYYSRISGLTKANLVRRLKGKYSLTLLGKIVYETHLTIGRALKYYWKLNAIESIRMSSNGLPKEELLKLVDALLDNHQVKEVITKALLETGRPFDSAETLESHQRFERTEIGNCKPITRAE